MLFAMLCFLLGVGCIRLAYATGRKGRTQLLDAALQAEQRAKQAQAHTWQLYVQAVDQHVETLQRLKQFIEKYERELATSTELSGLDKQIAFDSVNREARMRTALLHYMHAQGATKEEVDAILAAVDPAN